MRPSILAVILAVATTACAQVVSVPQTPPIQTPTTPQPPPIQQPQHGTQLPRTLESLTLGDHSVKPFDVRRSRACAKSFPWPQGHEEAKDVSADLMRQLRDSVEKYKSGDHSLTNPVTVGFELRERMFGGIDIEQHLLFADFVLLQKLQGEGRFEGAFSEGLSLIKKRQITPRAVPWTSYDNRTYFSGQNLKNLIFLATAHALVNMHVEFAPKEFEFIVSYLDSRAGLANVFGKLRLNDVTDELIERIATEELYHFDQPLTDRAAHLANVPHLLGAAKTEDGLLVELSGKRQYLVERTDDDVVLLEGRDAANRFDEFLSSELAANSSPEMPLFAVVKRGQQYILNFGGHSVIRLSDAEFKVLQGGSALPPEHPLSKAIASSSRPLLFYTNPLTIQHADVVHALQKSYPDALFIKDPYSAETKQHYQAITTLKTGSGVVAVVAEDSFAVKDYKLIQNIEDDLRTRGIDVVSFKNGSIQWKESGGKLVLVITGHIDEHLAEFVHALGRAGVLKDNFVLFNACRAPLSSEMAGYITSRYGASAVYTFDSVIKPEDLEPVLRDLPTQNDDSKPFIELWRDDVRRHKLNGSWTICWRSSLEEQAA